MSPKRKGKEPAQQSVKQPTKLEDDFDAIVEALGDGDYKKSLKVVDGVLTKSQNDKDALRAKVFSLIMLSRFDDALATMDAAKQHLPDTAYERAYCLWKLYRVPDALQAAKDVSDSTGLAHLQGLLHLRQGDGKAALAAYRTILPQMKGDKEKLAELAPNVLAAEMLSGEPRDAQASLKELRLTARDSYEIAYNSACVAIARDDAGAAQDLLELADTRGQEALIADGCSEAEVDAELTIVRAQLAHVLSEIGDTVGALERYSALSHAQLDSDIATAALATNNVAALRVSNHKGGGAAAQKLANDMLKKLESYLQTTSPLVLIAALRARLSSEQTRVLSHNYTLLSLVSARAIRRKETAAVREASAALAASSPDNAAAAQLAAAAAAAAGASGDAVASLEAWAAAHAEQAEQPLLLAAHIALQAKDAQRACELLRSDLLREELRFAPALVATRVALTEKLPEGSAGELEAALAWWRGQSAGTARSHACSWCLERLGTLAMRQGDTQGALQRFKELQAMEAQSKGHMPADVAAKLARALAALDASQVPTIADSLSAAPRHLPAEECKNAEELDLSYVRSKGTSILLGPVVKPASMKGVTTGGDAMDVDAAAPQRRAKRKRKPRYPKNFDPENPGKPPDPERWLPKYERAEYIKRRKRRERNQPVSKGAQGMGKVDESLDKSGITSEMLDARKASTSAQPKLPTHTAPKGAQGKRKGKR